jgi:beta-aspartyl-peptidase (threonine type)
MIAKNTLFLFLIFMSSVAMGQQAVPKDKVVLVIHGGAGTILKSKMTPQKEKAYTDALRASLLAGYDILKTGGSSEKAVEAAIHVMEDSPLFNAGKGAVFTHEGTNELDASIMKGKDGSAGAVAGVTTIKNPITAAIAVMESSPHVMMMGQGAERFAKEQGITQVEPSYFYTEERWDALQRILKEDSKAVELDHNDKQSSTKPEWKDDKFGTVGCVALDNKGDITAGTSTGGMTNKKFGRVGDSPVIGAGTYANKQVGISCTGWGEYFIRNVAAYDVAALMEYRALSALEASKEVIRKIGEMGGDGGMIVLDKDGNVALPFNTAGMYRGYITESGEVKVEIYK